MSFVIMSEKFAKTLKLDIDAMHDCHECKFDGRDCMWHVCHVHAPTMILSTETALVRES